jgi:hypothetical protein
MFFFSLYNWKLKAKKKKKKKKKSADQRKKTRNQNIINTSCDNEVSQKAKEKRSYIITVKGYYFLLSISSND